MNMTSGPLGVLNARRPGKPHGIGDGQRGVIFPSSFGRKAMLRGGMIPCS